MMAKKAATRKTLDPMRPIFQLKITVEDTEPAIWRRIQTHDCSLAELHEMIQSCMGWEDGQACKRCQPRKAISKDSADLRPMSMPFL